MKKEDLKYGNVIELKNGIKLLYHQHCKDNLLNLNGKGYGELDKFNEDLIHCMFQGYDIKRVYEDFTLSKVLWERKEKPKIVLNDDEKKILRNLPKEYKYIARDKNDKLFIYIEKPEKCSSMWFGCYTYFPYKHLFQFVKWEDEEPYSIEELLNE